MPTWIVSRAIPAKQPPDESKKSPPIWIIEARRSEASIFGAGTVIMRRAGKPMTFATREQAEIAAKRMKSDVESEFITFAVVKAPDDN
jgi:hypothetical protein